MAPETTPQRPVARDLGRLFEAVLLLVEHAATANGALLALEDLHWADPATWSLVSHLYRNLGSTPVLMAVSYREDDTAAGPGRTAMAELARDAAVERIRLEPLTGDDAHAFLRALPDAQLSDGDLATIVRRCEGVPFYLEELADQAATHASAVLPMSVLAAVEVRSSRLTPGARLVVDLVATSDGPVDARLLRAASGPDQAGLTDALQEAMASNLLVRAGARDELVDTRHTLVREALVEGLVPGQLARLHLAHADATEAHLDWAGTSDVERWRRFANHLLAAGERQRAVPALVRAGHAARQALAFQDADEAYRQALEHLGDSPPPVAGEAWRDVLAEAAAVARLAGAPERAVALQERVVALAGGTDDGHTMERIRLARYHAEAGQPGVARALLREVAASAPPELRGRCAMELARALLDSHDYPGAIEQAELARQAAQEAGDRREEARAAAAMGVALSMIGRHAEALSALAASRHAGLREDDEPTPTRARPSRVPDSLLRQVDRATILALAGDPESASRAALDGAATANRSGVTGPWAAVLAAVAGREMLRLGRWDDAWAALREAVGSDPPAAAAARVVQALLAVRRGDLATADSALAAVTIEDLASTPGTGWVGLHAMAVAELALARATLERARAAVADGLSQSDGDPDALQRAELAWLGLRIEADGVIQARDRRDAAAAGAGEASAMALFASGHSELASTTAPGLSRWVGALRSRLDAEVPRLRGIPDPTAWEAAVAHADQTPDVFGQAYARYRLAESLLDEGVNGRVLATRVLQDCLGLARGLGAIPMVEDAQRLAVRARVRVEVAADVESPPVDRATPVGSCAWPLGAGGRCPGAAGRGHDRPGHRCAPVHHREDGGPSRVAHPDQAHREPPWRGCGRGAPVGRGGPGHLSRRSGASRVDDARIGGHPRCSHARRPVLGTSTRATRIATGCHPGTP